MTDPFLIEGSAVISFSGGRTSGYMLRRILDVGLQPDVHVLFTNTGKERPETLECGSNVLTGADPDLVQQCVGVAMASARDWNPPVEYMRENVAETVVRIVTGFRLL